MYFTGSVNNSLPLSPSVFPTSGYYYTGSYDIAVGRYQSNGTPSWVRLFGSDKQDYGTGIVVDMGTGHLFVTGSSAATWNGPTGSPLNSHSGSDDIVVIRIVKSSGVYLSHAFYGSAYTDVGKAIAFTSNSKLVVVGYSTDTWNGPGNVSPIRAFTYGYEEMVVLSLTVDPLSHNMTYNWHTFYGSVDVDIASGVALDNSNNIYVAGTSDRSWNNGATSPKHAHSSSGSANDIAVVKLNSSGVYQWHTFYGSSSGDVATSIAYNGTDLFVGGYSALTWNGDGPTAPKHTHSGGSDLTILAINTSGAYLWHTFYGSSAADEGRGIAADASYVYLVGTSANTWNNGATPPMNAHSGDLDLAVVKVSASNGAYQWHSFYGSSKKDSALAATVMGTRLILAGFSENDWASYPLFHNGGRNTVTLELTTAGVYTWHRFAGRQLDDELGGMALDGGRNIILTGYSDHSWLGPANQQPKNPHGNVTTNLFVLKLNPSGGYLWHTFYGGSVATEGEDVAIGPSDMILVVGDSGQNWIGFGGAAPLRAHTGDGVGDIFIVALNSSGVYGWHTFISGANDDWAEAVAVYASDIIIAGSSRTGWNGPAGQVPINPYTPTGHAIVVAKYNVSGVYQWHTFYGSSSGDGSRDVVVDNTGYIYLAGLSNATWNGPGAVAPKHPHSNNDYDFTILKLNISGAYQWHTFYGGTGSDIAEGVALDSQKNVAVVGRCASVWLGDGNAQPKNNPNNPSISDLSCVLSLTSAGSYRWHTFYGGNTVNGLYAVAVDSKNFIYALGRSNQSWLGPGGQLPLHAHTGDSTDINLITLTSNGDYYEHDFFGCSGGLDNGVAVAVDPQGGLLIGGDSQRSWLGDNSISPLNSHKGATDILVLRLAPLTNRIFIPLVRR